MLQAMRQDVGEAHHYRRGQVPRLQSFDDLVQIDLAIWQRVGPHDQVAGLVDREVALAPRVDVIEIERVVDSPGLRGIALAGATVGGGFRVGGHYQRTLTFLNCHGSLLSRSSGNSRSRACNGVQSVYSTHDGPEIRHADLEVAAEIHFVRLDDAAVRILHRPDHSREAGDGDLQAGRAVVGRELARFLDRQLRAVPVRVLLVAGEQHAELVDAGDDVVHEDAGLILQLPVAAGELVHRHDRRVARVIGVMDRRAIRHLRALANRQVVGDRDRFAMRDAEAMEMPGRGSPGAHARCRAGLHQVDRRERSRSRAVYRRAESSSRGYPSRARSAAPLRSRSRRPTRC